MPPRLEGVLFATHILILASLARAADEPIGAVGASLAFLPGWKREALSPTLGPDQFHDDGGLFLTARELRGTFLEEADAARQLKLVTVGFEGKGGKPLSEVELDHRGGVVHASQSWALTTQGLRIAYDVQIFGQGGLGYMVMSWAPEKQKLQLARLGRHVAGRFKMPGAGSPWAEQGAPTSETHEVGDHQVRFTYAPTQFAPLAQEARSDAFAAIQAPDEMMSGYFLMERSDLDLEKMLDAAVEKASAIAESVTKVTRADRSVDGVRGRVATIEGTSSGGAYAAEVVVVPVADKIYLDLRFLSFGSLASRQPVWDAVVASVDVSATPVLDAFPIPKDTPAVETLSPEMTALLSPATRVGSVPWTTAMRRTGDEVYLQGYRGMSVVTLSTGVLSDFSVDGDAAAGLPIRRPDGLYVPGSDGQVIRGQDGQSTWAGFNALHLADAGARGLLIVRAAPAVVAPGFQRLSSAEGPSLLLRAADGTERRITTFPGDEVDTIEGTPSAALLVLKHAATRWMGGGRLVLVSLDSGEQRELGAWTQVGAIAADPAGWLVTGTPAGATTGVYRLSATGARTLLVSGQHAGAVPLESGELLLVTRYAADTPAAGTMPLSILRVPAATVAAHGPHFDPFTASDVQRFAVAAAASLGSDPSRLLADPASLRKFVDTASKLSEAQVGVPLPRDAGGVDRLLAGSAREPALGQEGYLLLSALLCDQLLSAGAVWAAPRSGGTSVPAGATFGIPDLKETEHAIGYLPQEIVRSELQDEEGWWDPASSIAELRDGRLIVIGVDPAAVQARVDAATRPGVEALDQKPVAEVVAWLQAEPGNAHLRETVYRRLAAAGRVKELAAVAAPFLRGGGASGDVHASLAGRVATGEGAGSTLVADLRAAIAVTPQDPSLYMLLGQAYEAAAGPDAAGYATACYRHVVDKFSYSDFAQDAKAAITRLGG